MVEAVVSSTDWSQFGGYAAPAYTQIPNEFLDQHMADLTDPELRVLLYIMRRTLGFHQVSCAASLPEISRGTVVGGVARDRGTGLAISTIQNALQGLLDKRLILRVRQRRPDGGDAASMYALNVQGGGTGSRWGGVPGNTPLYS